MQNKKAWVYGFLTIFWGFEIFSFSAETADVSGDRSRAIARAAAETLSFVLKKPLNSEDTVLFISHIIRKCAHMAEFAFLAVLVFLLIRSVNGRKMPYCALFVTAAYAAADELHQMFVPGRGPAVSDVMIDSCGAAVGILIIFFILKHWGDEHTPPVGDCFRRFSP